MVYIYTITFDYKIAIPQLISYEVKLNKGWQYKVFVQPYTTSNEKLCHIILSYDSVDEYATQIVKPTCQIETIKKPLTYY